MKYALKDLDNEKLNGSRVTLEEAVSTIFIVIIAFSKFVPYNIKGS